MYEWLHGNPKCLKCLTLFHDMTRHTMSLGIINPSIYGRGRRDIQDKGRGSSWSHRQAQLLEVHQGVKTLKTRQAWQIASPVLRLLFTSKS